MKTVDASRDADQESDLQASRFLRACRRQTTDRTPIWLMRQAGRYMPEYRAIRARHSMLEMIQSPQLAAEVTLQPIEAFDLDAAIIFSDILPPLIGMGLKLEFVKGQGPVLENCIESEADVERLATPPAAECMGPTLEAIALVHRELRPRGIPLIGFAGAPFTLACYAIQGGGSRMYEKAKQFMFTDPDSWEVLMNKLVEVVADYLIEQARHGAAALQVFDSWAGVPARPDYQRFIQPFNTRLFTALQSTDVPVVNFSTGTSTHLDCVAACGGDVIGVDWRLPLRQAWDAIGERRAIQGNLDPTTLLAPWQELRKHIDQILDRCRWSAGSYF